ncbi:nucleotidyltransferase domain-containing protein [Candidatus Nitrosotenuis chungbukensis]|uniref:nucleotidyltransferase domain-containing protein n=1 Tax=Candidatus Nitrosotenuis chungbukensis TaxID=1353246 RepID=UPI0012FEE423|nr:nucleotidyltransferase domain-containing protein [Candidatus Nitrosotenuis chungbukensis]
MLLHVYLEHVLGNKVAIALLRTMIRYRGKVFTVRGLANTAHVSINETALTVHDLEKLGIINIQPIGRAYHLELNEKSYIFNKIIEPIVNAEKNTISELIQTLRKHLDTKKIITAAIFGSVASAEEKIDSDIDLLIISNDHDHAIALVAEAGMPISTRFNGNLSPIIFTEKEFKAKQKGSLVQSIIGNHIMISGKRIVPGK